MPKANLTQCVELIADRVSKRNLKNCRAIIQLATWLKTLEDENRQLKQRVEELEIRVQKINNYGATPLTPKEAEKAAPVKKEAPITPGQLKRFRMSRQLSQAAMGALLGVSAKKYIRWESGKTGMLPAIEEKFRKIQKMKGSQLRTMLQELGFYQANGKKTRLLQGQDDDNAPAPAFTSESAGQKVVPLNIITKTQLRELRLKLGCTHPEMGARYGVKPKTWSNWEYGYCRPPEDIAKKLLSQYEELFGSPSPIVEQKPEAVPHHMRPKSKRVVYESELLPIAKLRAYRKESGLTMAEVAKRVGVPYTTYKNWEAGNAKPSTENVEKLLEVFGAPPTKSVTDSVRTHALAIQRKTDPAVGYEYPAETLRKFRKKHSLTAPQMARLMRVPLSQYRNWETHGRGVPPDYTSTFHVLSKLSSDNITKRLESSPAVEPKNLLHRKGEAYTFSSAFLDNMRKKLKLRYTEMAKVLGVTTAQYRSWLIPGRGVPPFHEAQVKEFLEMDDAAKRKRIAELGIIPGDKKLVHYSITAEALIAFRHQLGVSRIQFAKMIGVPVSRSHNWEAPNRGVPPTDEASVRKIMEMDEQARRKLMAKMGIVPQKHRRGKK